MVLSLPTVCPPTTITSPTAGRSVCWIACMSTPFGTRLNPRACRARRASGLSLSRVRESTDSARLLSRTRAEPRQLPDRARTHRLERRTHLGQGNTVTSVCTGMAGATRRNSSPSRARQVGDRAHAPLAPEELVGEGGDLAHVDAGADDGAALRTTLQRRRHELARRGEDDRRVELLRRPLVRAPAHSAPSARANAWPSGRRGG